MRPAPVLPWHSSPLERANDRAPGGAAAPCQCGTSNVNRTENQYSFIFVCDQVSPAPQVTRSNDIINQDVYWSPRKHIKYKKQTQRGRRKDGGEEDDRRADEADILFLSQNKWRWELCWMNWRRLKEDLLSDRAGLFLTGHLRNKFTWFPAWILLVLCEAADLWKYVLLLKTEHSIASSWSQRNQELNSS